MNFQKTNEMLKLHKLTLKNYPIISLVLHIFNDIFVKN